MNKKTVLLTVLMSFYFQVFAGPQKVQETKRPETELLDYKGFVVRASPGYQINPQLAEKLKMQIDMVMDSKLPDKVKETLKGVSIIIDDSKGQKSGSPAMYMPKEKKVNAHSDPGIYSDKTPIFLHELLHAYHDQFIPNGYQNQEILDYYSKAKKRNCYKPNTHFMQSHVEFFAIASTIVLWGPIQQPPYNLQRINQCQTDDFVEFLKKFQF
ncbi:MAG: hypothetical protein ACHQYQ_03535 [Bacteriovoracales bacterium]